MIFRILLTFLLLVSTTYSAGFEVKGVITAEETGALSHGKNVVAIDASGNFYMAYKHNTSTSRAPLSFSLNWGADTLSTGLLRAIAGGTVLPTATIITNDYNFYVLGDSLYFMSSYSSATEPTKVAKIIDGDTSYNDGGNGSLVDTALAISATASRPGMVYMGPESGYLIVVDSEAATDQTIIYQTNGSITQTTTYTKRGQSNTIPNGQRLGMTGIRNVKAGVLMFDINSEDLFWADSTGFTTLSVDLIPGGDMLNLNGIVRLITLKDSFAVVIYQRDTTSTTNHLIALPFHLTSGASGSPTGIVTETPDTIVAAGTFTSRHQVFPDGVWLGGDSVRFFWKQFDGTYWDIMTAFSDSRGSVTGAPEVFIAGTVATQKRHELQVSNAVYIGSTLKFAISSMDSTGVANDTIRTWFETITLSSPAVPQNKLFRSTITRSGKS